MKKLIYLPLAIVLLCTSSCSSSSDDTPIGVSPQNQTGFVWHENTPTATAKNAGSAELRTLYKSIFAFQGSTTTSGTLFEINLTGTSPATYDLATSGNAFYFSGFPSSGTITGKVIITKNESGKASGTFEASSSGSGAITKVYGSFTDIPVQ
ncbi:MAG: hypothetical protein JSS94_06050 [Bacteroidetes bacterium]|nr:hypothetical protein [Bacteroidota bacterium]